MAVGAQVFLPVAGSFDIDWRESSGLSLRVKGGMGIGVDGRGASVPGATLTLLNNAVTYIELATSGVMYATASAFTAGRAYLYKVTCASGLVTAVVDWRYSEGEDPLVTVNALQTLANALRLYVADGMLVIGTVVISAAPATSFKSTSIAAIRIGGITYLVAATDPVAFSAANTINVGAAGGSFWGGWMVEAGIDGVMHTKPAGGLANQVYATEPLAKAAALLVAPTAAHTGVAIITVQCNAGVAWTANTSTLTVGAGAGNCQARNFYDLPTPATLPAAV